MGIESAHDYSKFALRVLYTLFLYISTSFPFILSRPAYYFFYRLRFWRAHTQTQTHTHTDPLKVQNDMQCIHLQNSIRLTTTKTCFRILTI